MQAETSVAEAVIGDDTVRSPNATAPIPGLVWAFRIHSDGSPESLAVDQPIEFTHDGLLWLHFNLADARALHGWLLRTFKRRSRRDRCCCQRTPISSSTSPTIAYTASFPT